MSKTTTTNQYAALSRQEGEEWHKIHAFTLKSKEAAERHITEHKNKFVYRYAHYEYKIVKRTVTITTEEWVDA